MADPVSLGVMLSVAGTGLSAASTIAGGKAAESDAKFRAAQLRQQGLESRAAGQRKAFEQRREGNLLMSRLQARAAASGGGADDPTVIKLGEDIAARSEYGALSEMFTGENRARGYEDSAAAALVSGKAAKQGSYLKAGGTILSGAGSMFSKFNTPTGGDAWAGLREDDVYGYG